MADCELHCRRNQGPQRNLSRAMVVGVAGVIVPYIGVNFVCV